MRQHYATHVERHASRFIPSTLFRRVYDVFGPRRTLWGPYYSRLQGPYHDAIRLFTEALDFLSKDDIEWIIDNTAGEWMGCGPDGLM